MAFDAGMLACVIHEIKTAALGARIEKVSQPEKDEIVLQMRSFEGGRRLLIHAGSNNPRIGFPTLQQETPLTAPMLCLLLRKHLSSVLPCWNLKRGTKWALPAAAILWRKLWASTAI